MKKITILFFGAILLFTACGDDRDGVDANLRYDGDNFTAPLLQADTYEAAARFPASTTQNFVGQQLTEVSYYMAGTPQQTILRVYSGGTETEPGQVVYEASLTGSINQNTFNTHVLSTPVDITGEPLWLSIRFRQNRVLQTIGCDQGPNRTGGDMFYVDSDKAWTTFGVFANGESINWNIRGVVE